MVELFLDRADAGAKLARKLLDYRSVGAIVLGVPMGGVIVAYEVARALGAELDVVIPRKLPIPWNVEAGFGAMTIDGGVVLNRPLVESLRIGKREIEAVTDMVGTEIRRRDKFLRGDRPPPLIEGRTVVIVDDGLASGYTMLAAVRYLKAMEPSMVIAAAPAASAQAASLINKEVDAFVSPVVSSQIPFAVADFYLSWRDLSDDEVKTCLEEAWRGKSAA